MGIFNLSEVFEQLKGDMAKAGKSKADEAKVATYASRLTAVGAERPKFDAIVAELESDSGVSAAELVAIASGYNKGGRKPTSKAAALAMIKKRFVEIVRFHAKNKVAEKARPW